MNNEAERVRKRIELWHLLGENVQYSNAQLARKVGASEGFVRKWRQRLQQASGDAMTVFMSRSRRRKTSPRQVTEVLEAKILHLREHLSQQYGRRVGARNILYHLNKDADLQRIGSFIPKSQATVHEVLVRYGRVPRPQPRLHVPREPAEPLMVWEMDFRDVPTARSNQTDKRQHQVEALNVIDSGTSIALASPVSDRFDAQHTLIALIDILQRIGMPLTIRFDRDPRLVASWSADEFPSALMRFLLCVGITPDVCPPQRPDLKPYVERFNRTQLEECIAVHKPATVDSAQQVLLAHGAFYNLERPNQAVTCGNQPPSIALGQVPYLPRLPGVVDPDAWLKHYHLHTFKRHINPNGSVRVGSQTYYIQRRLAGKPCLIRLQAHTQQLQAIVEGQVVKAQPIRGLYHGQMAFSDYVEFIIEEARSEEKRYWEKKRRQRASA